MGTLRDKRFATVITGAGSRVPKYAHRFSETLNLGRREIAVLCELILRGPQTIGELRKVPREDWGQRENAGFDFVRTLFPNVSVFLAPEIAQIAQLFPGPTPDRNRTVLTYARRKPVTDAADQESCGGRVQVWVEAVE